MDDLSEGTITVQTTEDFTPKNGDDRTVYISGDAREVLQRLYAEAGEPSRARIKGAQDVHKMCTRCAQDLVISWPNLSISE
jgi:hypothetical protein